ncbi:UDP-N-acetylglucosamine 2-epimerase [Caldalkalibacillus mannanilyticus]|uniref:UDP-N-acetylglucosamine 2-epimerase n=1 Tax=Caldalkalibacillus mannanilyticus TaxID=1418 RepID=UPI0004681CC2|nr:UDP-N-acetylglucosamine 2-epimerase [Caldalkalibacillus mannanilyticus]
MIRRKICIVTGTRAEYGLFYWLMKEIQDDPELELQVVVTGMHLSPEFGLTYKQIEQDGFPIHEKIDMLLSADSAVAIAKSMGLGTIGFADAFARLQPDLIVLLGDRYEILAAAQAALVARMAIAHIHGGETTEGAIDEAIRHAVTKMSHLHFVASASYAKRVIQLGESPERVFNYGAIGIDNIRKLKLLQQDELEASLGISLSYPLFLVTYHPETLLDQYSETAITNLLEALDSFPEATILFTKANSDTDGRIINQKIDEYCASHPERTKAYSSLGQVRYLSTLQLCHVVIGNSSSGIIEAPFYKKPTVNIGNRQKGRLQASSIINTDDSKDQIIAGIRRALSAEFVKSVGQVKSPYGEGNVSEQIKETLKKMDLTQIITKTFYDLEG